MIDAQPKAITPSVKINRDMSRVREEGRNKREIKPWLSAHRVCGYVFQCLKGLTSSKVGVSHVLIKIPTMDYSVLSVMPTPELNE